MTTPVPWTCPACKTQTLTPFCGQCGEEPVTPHDLSFGTLMGKFAHAFTSIVDSTAANRACDGGLPTAG